MDQWTLARRRTGLIGHDPEHAFPGYTLYTPLAGGGAETGLVRLVDMAGTVVHEWRPPWRAGRHARILPNGNLAYNGVHPDGPELFPFWEKYRGGVMAELAPDGTVVREHRDPLAHHDAHHLGDGRVLYTVLEELGPAASAAVRGGVPGTEHAGAVYADVITEVDADGTETWRWHAAEHLDPDEYPLGAHYPREHWPLINSVVPMADGTVLASLRSVSAVIVIDRASGKVLRRSAPGTVSQQHHAQELPGGNVLAFDNGVFRPGESVPFSRVVELDPELHEVVWSWRDPQPEAFFTPFMGAVQRLPGGNTLITESGFGRLFEVTREGRVCWEYVLPEIGTYADERVRRNFPGPSNALFRAYRYAPDELPWLDR